MSILIDLAVIIGTIIISSGLLGLASWFLGWMMDQYDWWLPAWIWSITLFGVIMAFYVYIFVYQGG